MATKLKPPADILQPPSDVLEPPADILEAKPTAPPAAPAAAPGSAELPPSSISLQTPDLSANQALLGMLEQPAAGLGWMASTAISSLGTIADMVVNAINPKPREFEFRDSKGNITKQAIKLGNPTPAGMSIGQRFVDEQQALYQKLEDKIPFMPETEGGKKILEFIVEHIVTPTMQAVGDTMYQGTRTADMVMESAGIKVPLAEERAAAAGAIGQAGTILAALMAPKAGKRAAIEPTGDPVKDFAAKYPSTTRAIEASRIGNTPLTEAIKATPDQHVVRTATELLDKELGITADVVANSPAYAQMSVGDKVKLVIQKYAAQTGDTISLHEQNQMANALVDQLMGLQQKIEAARALPALPMREQTGIEGPITVDSKGVAVTPEQWGDYKKKFDAMTPEQRAVELRIGPMGVLREQLTDYAKLRDVASGSDKPADAAAARAAHNKLKQTWASIFSNPKDTAARSAALEQYINKAGEMTYDEALKAVGPRKGIGGKQKGMVDVSGLNDIVEKLKEGGMPLSLILPNSEYTSKVFEALPQNRPYIRKQTIKDVLNRQDIVKADKDVFNRILENTSEDRISAKDLVTKFQLETGNHTLEPKQTTQYAGYGNDRIGRTSDTATTTLWRLPEHMEMDGANHFNEPRLFGHTRSFTEDGVRHVVEVQSDLMQHVKVISPERYKELLAEYQKLVDEDVKLWPVLNKIQQAGVHHTSTVADSIATAAGFKSGKEAFNRAETIALRIEEIKVNLQGTVAGSQLGEFKQTWPRRLVREELMREARKVQSLKDEDYVKLLEQQVAEKEGHVQRAQQLGQNLQEYINKTDGLYGDANGFIYTLNKDKKALAELEAYVDAPVMRFATADTMAKVEGWPTASAMDSLTAGAIAREQGTAAAAEYLKSRARFSKEHQGIYDRHKRDVEGYAKQLGGKEVTDAQGFTWIEVPLPKPGPKYMYGILDIEGLGKNAEQAKAVIEKGIKTPGIPSTSDANHVKNIVQKNFKAMEDSRRVFDGKILQRARRELYAHDYDYQVALRNAGPYGIAALRQRSLQAGATMAAEMTVKDFESRVFDKLSYSEHKAVDEVTHLRRVIQIDKYKGEGVTQHVGGITGKQAEARLYQMKQELGDATYGKVFNASTAIFDQQLALLDKMLINDLISKTDYENMKGLNYQRREWLDLVDPVIPIKSHVRGLTDVRSSGLKELGHGKDAAINMDAQQLLNEDIIRVENRIFRNNSLKAVRELAIKNPENGFVRIPPKELLRTDKAGNQAMKYTPQGWTSIGVRVSGRQEFLLMRDEMAEQFVNRPEAMPEWMATTFRTISGSSLIKATSTTYNPEFILRGLPMDIFHTWLADTNVYSPHLPVYLAQMGKDLTATAADAFGRKGAWEAAMREGIGNSYMTHESRALLDPSKVASSTANRHLQKLKTALTYLGESTDMWVRLAHRNRLMKNGLSSIDASAEARMRLDYFQGGRTAKALDTFIPYTNVAFQGTGKIIEAAARDPQRMAIKSAWFVATAASATLANMIASPDTHKAISAEDKSRSLNITFGDQYYILDQDGNKRYVYIPVRLDQTLMPLMASVVGGLEKSEYGRIPDGLFTGAAGQISPISKAIPIPTADAIASYIANYDTLTGRSIYTGPKVEPSAEIRTFGQGKPTSQAAIAAAQAVGASPMRLEVAAKKLLNTNNTYIEMMGGFNKLLFEGADPREQAASTEQMLLHIPELLGFIKLTSPGIQSMKDAVAAEEAANTKIAPIKSGLDDLMFQFNHKQNGVTEKTIATYINSQPVEHRQQLLDHFKTGATVDKLLKRYEASVDIPQRTWWLASAKMKPEVRGQAFASEWLSASPEGRKRMENIAAKIPGYKTEEFTKSFSKDIKLLGTEQR